MKIASIIGARPNFIRTKMEYTINRWLAIVVMSILVTVVSVGTVFASPMIADTNSGMFAYKDSNNIVHITTNYYMANSTSTGTFDFIGLDGTILATNSPVFEAGYGEDSEKLILNSSFEMDLDGDNKPDGWTYNLDLFGKFLSILNINIWEMSTNKAIDGKYSLELDDNIGFLRKEAYSDAIPISQGKRYRINGSIYVEHIEYIRPAAGYGVYILWFDEEGNLVRSREGMKIYETPKRWINFSYYVWNIPNEAKYGKVLLRQSRSAKGHTYFDNVRVTELVETSTTTRLSKPVNPILIVDHDTAVVSYKYSLPEVDILTNYTFHRTTPYVDYSIKMNYKHDTIVRFEKIIFDINSNEGIVLLKDYNTTSIEDDIFASGQWSPKIVEFKYPPTESKFSFIGGDDMQSMVVQPKNNSFSELDLYLDDEHNHPHRYFKENKILSMDETKRVVDETTSYYITFSVNNSEKYIAKMRQPYGYLATLIFTEHPDGEETAKSRAIAYGYSDLSNPEYRTKGFLGNNLTWTKGIFVYDFTDHFTDALMEKPEYKTLIDKMFLDGVEIVPHTMTWTTDNRTIVSSGLDVLDQYNVHNWIDHGARSGKENFEDLASQGWDIQSDHYILDLLHDHNYEYAWGYFDYPITEGLNILEPDKTSVINPFMYYNNRIDDDLTDAYKIFLWNTINTEKRPGKYYTKANVDRLINEKGIHIGHEYFDWETCEGHAYDKLLFKDKYKINDIFENELEYIAQRKSEGVLWVTTVSEFGDYLRSISNVRIIYDGNNEYTIKNDNIHAVNGLALITEKTNINNVLINDTTSSNIKVVGNDIIFWIDIDAGSEKRVRFE